MKLKYLKDIENGAVRKFDMDVPKSKRKYDGFNKAPLIKKNTEGKSILVAEARWNSATESDYKKYAGIKVAPVKEVVPVKVKSE